MKNPYTVFADKPREFFNLIPQTGVTHLLCEEDPQHNAVWDMAISPEGRVFFSACGESYLSLYARLYEYDKKEKKLIRHIELEREILMNEEGLRTSKFHTALSFIGDGKILTATHTTSPAPSHPTWMPYEFADHPYECYEGSNLLIYDYIKHECHPLGVLSPFDTVYGATYDPKNGDYFGITWMRGTGYVYNVHTGERRCLGQVSDTHTSRTFLLSDGHIYGSTYSGAMFRYNTDMRDIEYLGVSAPGLIRHAREYDGVLYFTTGPCSVVGRGQELYAYDLKTRKITTVGRPVPKAEAVNGDKNAFYNAYGMAFDSKGRMWYGCMTYVSHHRYVGAKLYTWDFLHGGEPIDCGFLGTERHTLSITAEMHIVDDVLYISDGNHTSDVDFPCGIVAIELDKFVEALDSEERITSHDYVNYLPYQDSAREWYPGGDFDECLARYMKHYNDTVLYFEDFTRENSARYPFSGVSGVSVWERVGRGNTAVKEIRWTAPDAFSFVTGDKSYNLVNCTVDEGGSARLVDIKPTEWSEEKTVPEELSGLTLPAVRGRRYLAECESFARLSGGRIAVGTRDSMLAIVDGDRVFSLGRVTTAGAVRSLAVTPGGTLYGVASHKCGVGQLFRYTDECGIESLGLIPEAPSACGRQAAIYRPSVISASPDGKYLAVGGEDELGGVVVIKI